MSYSKYIKYKKQVSYNNGYTWETIYPEETQASGNPLGTYDTLEECLNSSDFKFIEISSNGNVASAECTSCGGGTLRENDIPLISGKNNPTHLYVGDCIRKVDMQENATVHYFSGITFSHSVVEINAIVGYRYHSGVTQTLEIPNSVETLAMDGAYWNDYGFTGVENIVFEENSTLKAIGGGFMWIYANNQGNYYIENIDIPNSVKYIGNNAFRRCYNLKSVHLPSNLKEINSGTFQDCTLLSAITIPNTVTSIGEGAFQDCSGLTSVIIPESVKIVNGTAFRNCYNLPYDGVWYHAGNMIFRDENEAYSTISSVPTIPDGTKYLGYEALDLRNNNLDWSNFKIPSSVKYIDGNSYMYTSLDGDIAYIDTYCRGVKDSSHPPVNSSYTVKDGTRFLSNIGYGSLEELTLPNSLEVIMNLGISSAKIKNLVIPSNVWYISGMSCKTLSSVTFSNDSKLEYINDYTFSSCSALTSIEIPAKVTRIGANAFSGCKSLTSATFEEGSLLEEIGKSAFSSCSALTSIEIPAKVTRIGANAFSGCSSLTSVTFEEGSLLEEIGDSAFRNCTNLTTIRIPSKTIKINGYAFWGCTKLTNLVIPSSVEFFGAYNLWYTSIGNLVFPDGIKYIDGIIPFDYMIGTVEFKGDTPPAFDSSMSKLCYNGILLKVPCEYIDIYKSCWPSLTNYIYCGELDYDFQISATTKYINVSSNWSSIAYANNDANLSMIEVNGTLLYPNRNTGSDRRIIGTQKAGYYNIRYSLTNPSAISGFSFLKAADLTSITVGSGITSIGDRAFSGCSALTSITVLSETPPTLVSPSGVFSNTNNCPIYVPAASVNTYKSASGWSYYSSRLQAIPT